MGNFNRGGGGGRFGRDGGGRGFGGRNSGRGGFGGKPWDKPRIMHKAICSNCGRECEVPFRPDGSKPVLCNDCFSKAKGNPSVSAGSFARKEFSPAPSFQTGGGDRRIDEIKKQLDALNSKIDTLIKAMEKPAPIVSPVSLEAPKTTLKKLVKKATSPKKISAKKK